MYCNEQEQVSKLLHTFISVICVVLIDYNKYVYYQNVQCNER